MTPNEKGFGRKEFQRLQGAHDYFQDIIHVLREREKNHHVSKEKFLDKFRHSTKFKGGDNQPTRRALDAILDSENYEFRDGLLYRKYRDAKKNEMVSRVAIPNAREKNAFGSMAEDTTTP